MAKVATNIAPHELDAALEKLVPEELAALPLHALRIQTRLKGVYYRHGLPIRSTWLARNRPKQFSFIPWPYFVAWAEREGYFLVTEDWNGVRLLLPGPKHAAGLPLTQEQVMQATLDYEARAAANEELPTDFMKRTRHDVAETPVMTPEKPKRPRGRPPGALNKATLFKLGKLAPPHSPKGKN